MPSPELYAIDFGTSNSLLAAATRTEVFPAVALDPEAADPTVLRSILHFAGGEVRFGAAALDAYVRSGMEGRLLRSLKRFLPVESFRGTQIGSNRYALEDLVAAILRRMRERANEVYAADVRRAVLGRPAAFSEDPRSDELAQHRLLLAAHKAGFEQVHFCPEPLAAACDFQPRLQRPSLVLVADFGGGTSDFSVVRLRPGAFAREDVLSIGGVSVAGDALDGAMMRKQLSGLFGADVRYRVPMGRNILSMPASVLDLLSSPADLSMLQRRELQAFLADVRSWSLGADDRRAMDRLLCVAEDGLGFQVFEAVERTKIELSSRGGATFSFDYPGAEARARVERASFEAACEPCVSAISSAMDATLQRAGVSAHEVDWVCMTGGTARVPRVARALRERFGTERQLPLRGLHAVVEGLARYGRMLVSGALDDSAAASCHARG